MRPKERVKLLSDLSQKISTSFTWPLLKELFDQYGFQYDVQSTLSKRDFTRDVISKLPESKLFELAGEFEVDIPSQIEIVNIPADRINQTGMKKIFISHATADKKIVGKIIEIIRATGVSASKIFCTSYEGYSIKLGENFLEIIKQELNNDVLVLFVLSENFYASPVCLCEMGAAWVTTKKHIPILIPPFSYSDVKGVIPNTQGMMINDKSKLNSLKTELETFFDITDRVNPSIWEDDRDNILSSISTILS